MDEARLEHLGEMLWYADMAYEGESERTLHDRLVKKGAFAAYSMKLVGFLEVEILDLKWPVMLLILCWPGFFTLLPATAASPNIASSHGFNADPPHYLDCFDLIGF